MVLIKKIRQRFYKKLFFVVSVLFLAVLMFNFIIPTAEALTVSYPLEEVVRPYLYFYIFLISIEFLPLSYGAGLFDLVFQHFIYFEPLIGIIAFLFHLYIASCLMFLAKKTKTPHCWMAFIPALNIYLLCKIAGRSSWWTVLYFFPLILLGYLHTKPFLILPESNSGLDWLFHSGGPGPMATHNPWVITGTMIGVVFFIFIIALLWKGVVKKIGRRGFWAIFMIIPLINLIIMGFLAFSKKRSEGVAKPEGSS